MGIVSFLLFLLSIFAVLYLPGRWLLRSVGFSEKNTLSTIVFSFGAGIAIFLCVTYLLAWIHYTYLYLIFVVVVAILEILPTFREMRKNFLPRPLFSIDSLIFLGGIILMLSGMADSGWMQNGNMIFHGTNAWDGIFHIALINNMAFQFPSSYPGLSATMLQGYHILYDFLLSQFVSLFKFSTSDLYFRFFAFFTAFFYGAAGLTLANAMKMNTFTRRIFLFLLFFGQGIEFFLFYWSGNYRLYDSGIVQPIGNIVDPSVLFSISFVFLLVSLLFMKIKKQQVIVPILFLGIIPGIKIYTGILAYAAYGVIALYKLLQKDVRYLVILVLSGIISGAVYLPFNIGAGHLIFNPFLSIRHFMESDKVFTSFQWVLKLQYYSQQHNSLRIMYLYSLALLFYFVPPLGIRLVSIKKIHSLLNRNFYTIPNIFLLIFISVGFLLPLFFIQSVAVFNTVQFYWIIWIALLIPTAFGLAEIIGKTSQIKKNLLWITLIILAIPALSFPYLIHSSSTLVIPKDLLIFSQRVKQNVWASATILVINRRYNNGTIEPLYQTPLFGALIGRPMYYEPEQGEFSEIQRVENSRQKVVESVDTALQTCQPSLPTILHMANVQYVILLHTDTCPSSTSGMKKILQDGTYSFYQVL